jgi:rod shape-determining protein MreD
MALQTGVFPSFSWLPVVPDLFLVLVVYLGIRHRSVSAACGAFLLGYFLDTFSGTLLGLNAFAFTVVYVAVALIARNLWLKGGAPVAAVVFVGACVRELAVLGVAPLVADSASLWHHVLRHGVLEAGAAALVAPAVFACVNRERQLLGLE